MWALILSAWLRIRTCAPEAHFRTKGRLAPLSTSNKTVASDAPPPPHAPSALALAARAGVGACAPRGAQVGHCGSASATNPPLLGFLPGLGQTIVRRRARYDVLRSGGRDTPSELANLHGRQLESRVAMRAARSHPAPRVPSVPTPTLPTLAVPDCVAVPARLHEKLDFGCCMECI